MNEVNELLEKIENDIKKLEAYKRELVEEDYSIENLEIVKERVKNKPVKPKFETGISFLDRRLYGGFTEGSFVNIAGSNFSGKTELVLTILSNISKFRKVLFFSFEMYENRIAERTRGFSDTQNRNFLIEQKRNSLDDIEAIIRNYAKKEGVDFVAIDSRMKIEVTGNKEEYQKNSEISRRLSKLTQELGIVLLLINQISEVDLRNKRPSLKGSGDQAYDSDVILYIVQPTPQKGEINSDTRIMVCEKDRVNQRKWKEEYTINDLKGDLSPTVIEYIPEV